MEQEALDDGDVRPGTILGSARDDMRIADINGAWKRLGVLLAALALLSALHAAYVVPAILQAAREQWQRDIDRAIAPIEARTRRIEDKVDRLVERPK